jgi:glycine cleavage system T protein (aminomethyltransferase)
LEEHKVVRKTAGLFDVSHMGEVDVRGPDAERFLSHLVTNDVAKLFPGRVQYTVMCYPNGGVIDDLLVYKRGAQDFFLCINAGNVEKDVAWIQDQAAAFDVAITDRSADYALLAVQGPAAAAIVQSLTGAKLDLIKYYHFAEGTVGGVQCLISRTGYTGEDGFELYHAAADAPALAEALLAAGAPRGMELVGLGARDSLRLEAGYPLYGHEISAEISPITAGLGWVVKMHKPDFIGRTALEHELQHGSARKVIYFQTADRRIPRAGTQVLALPDRPVGSVLSGTLSPLLNVAIGSAIVGASYTAKPLAVEIRGEKIPLQLVKPPFVQLKASS